MQNFLLSLGPIYDVAISAQAMRWYFFTGLAGLMAVWYVIWMRERMIKYGLVLSFLFLAAMVGSAGGLLLPNPEIIKPRPPLFDPVKVSITHPLVIEFDRPFNSNQLRADLSPGVDGVWLAMNQKYKSGRDKAMDTLVFVPSEDLDPGREYTVSINDINDVFNWGQAEDYLFLFTTVGESVVMASEKTEDNVIEIYGPEMPDELAGRDLADSQGLSLVDPEENFIKQVPTVDGRFELDIPWVKQDDSFSCFSAAAQMVLNYYDIDKSQAEIRDMIGHDDTPRNFVTNIWGNPNEAIVGTMDGSGPGGYGVHWGPVAQVLSQFREAEVKQNWSIEEMLVEVEKGRPVMVWWVNGVWPAREVSWNTPDGKKVYTVNGMHVEVVKGWIGKRDKPEYILTNDPWRRERHYDLETFRNLWKWFENTAIIVY